MEIENARRNLKDFLSMYNQFTENCFERCIQNLNYRVLTPQEESCVNKCVSKLINVNHREISVYMEINPLNRRLNELSNAADPQELLMANAPDLAQEIEHTEGKGAVTAAESIAPAVDSEPSVPAAEAGNMDSSGDKSYSPAPVIDVASPSIPQATTDKEHT